MARDDFNSVTVRLDATPRRLAAAFPLAAVGFLENHPVSRKAYRGKLELCLRLGSTKAVSRDRFDDEVHECRLPNAVFKMPDKLHRYVVDAPRDAVYFAYAPELAPAMAAAGLFAPPRVRELRDLDGLRRPLREIRALLPRSQEDGVADRLDLLALRVFAEVLLGSDDAGEADGGVGQNGDSRREAEAKIRRIASRLHLRLGDPEPWGGLVRENGFSRRPFFRHWRRVMGTTPAAYLRDLRLAEAERLLGESSWPVSRVAAAVGYADANHFHVAFKRRTGLTPGQWRERQAGER